jgi:hypothetical protein
VKLAIAHYHTWCGKRPNYSKSDELLQEVGRELEHERRKAWPTDVPKAGADMVRWVSATRMLVICLLDQANLCRSRAYDEHGNFEKNGGLSRLEQAVELFRAGELVYNEPSYRPYRNTSHGINLIRVWDVAKSAAASLKAAKEQHHQGLVPEPACFSQAASVAEQALEAANNVVSQASASALSGPAQKSAKRRKTEQQARHVQPVAGAAGRAAAAQDRCAHDQDRSTHDQARPADTRMPSPVQHLGPHSLLVSGHHAAGKGQEKRNSSDAPSRAPQPTHVPEEEAIACYRHEEDVAALSSAHNAEGGCFSGALAGEGRVEGPGEWRVEGGSKKLTREGGVGGSGGDEVRAGSVALVGLVSDASPSSFLLQEAEATRTNTESSDGHSAGSEGGAQVGSKRG